MADVFSTTPGGWENQYIQQHMDNSQHVAEYQSSQQDEAIRLHRRYFSKRLVFSSTLPGLLFGWGNLLYSQSSATQKCCQGLNFDKRHFVCANVVYFMWSLSQSKTTASKLDEISWFVGRSCRSSHAHRPSRHMYLARKCCLWMSLKRLISQYVRWMVQGTADLSSQISPTVLYYTSTVSVR